MKKRNLSRKKYKKILNRLITVTMLLIVIMNFVSPMINVSYAELGTRYYENKDSDSSGIVMGSSAAGDAILSLTTGAVGGALSIVVLLVVGILYMLILLLFSPIFGANFLPGPEDIIYNAVPIFDPNFVHPSDRNLVGSKFYLAGDENIKNFILQFYQTGYVIAGSIFVIGAMIIGIKLAVTSIASEKAYYKEMIGTWIKGLVLLFTVHILITGVFYINEQIVNALNKVANVDNLEFKILYSPGGVIGKTANSFMSSLGMPEVKGTFEAKGIGGLICGLIVKAMNDGDLIAAIAVAALLGQTVSLIVTYFKRVFVCIALAAIAPYIVAVDFIRKLI